MKSRVTVSLDADVTAAAAAAVTRGEAESVSAWINQALVEKVERERKLAAATDAIAAFEADHGEISDQELVEQERADRDAAALLRASAKGRRRTA